MAEAETKPLRESDLLAALDLGSNSFHLVVAHAANGPTEIIEHKREAVQLAAGIGANGELDPAYLARALTTLTMFSRCLESHAPRAVRAVATHAVRSLRDSAAFVQAANAALGQSIEIISGRREAELVWRGVAHAFADNAATRLVVDVGGGSTELIIGQGTQARFLRSVPVGCVTIGARHFPGGELTADRWQRAQQDLRATLAPFVDEVCAHKWDQGCATSGTASAIAGVGRALGLASGVTHDTLAALREHLLHCGHTSRIDLPGLRADRRSVIAGGVAVMQAVFDVFNVRHLQACPQSLRDGLLWEMRKGADPD